MSLHWRRTIPYQRHALMVQFHAPFQHNVARTAAFTLAVQQAALCTDSQAPQ